MSNSSIDRILVVKNRAMGDAVIGLSTLQYLRSIFPKSHITYMVPAWVAPLFQNTQTAADQIIGINLKGIKDALSLNSQVKAINPDIVFELFQSGRTAKFFKLHRFLGGYKYLSHNHHLKSGESNIIDQGVYKANIQRDLDGVWSLISKPRDLGEIPHYLNFEPKIEIQENILKDNSVIFGVVATRQTKMWPLEYYIDLAKKIKSFDNSIEIKVPLGPGDNEIKKVLSKEQNLFEFIELPLNKLIPQIFSSQLYIGNDTGIKHIAIALGIKSYTLFGPEPPKEWHPYDIEKHPYFYRDGLECRTVNAHYCGLNTCDSMICLNKITAQDVFERIKKDLANE
ncbi:MAG: glycosyltransferase family 9 protein [Oligoflexia bacterium]|nr:glycosyltransferase family 9 protein [Oligoflexia bacterium]